MELFKGQSLLEFTERFKTDLDCEEYLASLKWEDGYCCRKLRGIYSWGLEFNIDCYLAEIVLESIAHRAKRLSLTI